ncbi:MAG: Xaa-Pro dipeptidyl-peptidase [Planctomycetes bacterium]|nr:Xaa-Pro dipeptidyl-peptidase [Planctomycetota bacterium]
MSHPRSHARNVLVPLFLGALPIAAQEAERARPVFVDGQAQVVPGFSDPARWIRHDLWVETEFDSDGDGQRDRMHVDVTRPAQTESEGLKVPVVYESSPYYSGTGTTAEQFMWDPHQELGEFPNYRVNPPPIPYRKPRSVINDSHLADWVPRGFAVVHSESVGTGQSQGCPFPGDKIEALAPKAVIDWLCGRAQGYTSAHAGEAVKATWCTGKVGMTGTSYNGTLPVAAATTGVAGLEAIIPVAPITSYYRYYRSNGLVRHPGGYRGEDIDVIYDFIHSNDPALREACNESVRDGVLMEGFDRASGDLNDFWKSRDYVNQLDSYHAATLMAHAFNDWNVMAEHSVRLYLALEQRGVPTQCYFHQGGHGGPPPLAQMNRWFTRYLYGVENGVEKDARAWIVREHADPSKPTPYADYPNPAAAPVTLFPTRGGAELGGLATQRAPAQERETLVDDASIPGATLAAAAQSPNRLLFSSPELKQPVHLSGTGHITLRLAADRPAANLSVWIVSLPWTGSKSINDDVITRTWADPQNAASLTSSKPLAPGQFVELHLELQPDDQIVPAGERIGLMVFASDHDFTLWPEPGTELTLDLDASELTLPVVGGPEAWAKATGPDR